MELAQALSRLFHPVLAEKFCVWAMSPMCPGMTPLQPGSSAPVPSRSVGFILYGEKRHLVIARGH